MLFLGVPALNLDMFVRKKPNKSGLVSIQIIDKRAGRYRVAKTVGSSKDPTTIAALVAEAEGLISSIVGQQSFNFDVDQEKRIVDLFFKGIKQIQLVGPELILGKLFDEIGFNKIKDELFRHLVIARLVNPVSKLKTTDYLFKYKGITIEVDKIYRYLDKLHNTQKEAIQQISYQHTLTVLNNDLSIVFYDVTTLYFEIEDEDDLRKTGFSKEGKHQHPQILLGLLVSMDGYPLAYEIFEGNKFEGHTMLPVIEAFKAKYQLKKLVVIADAGLLSNENLLELQSKQYEYILGARLKNEKDAVKRQVLALSLENGQSIEIIKDENTKLIISYSQSRAKKDAANRRKGLQKLERNISRGKLTKQHINNRGYNKYLKLTGEVQISINYDKYNADQKWDGLKGYLTNTKLNKDEVIAHYGHLWKIEKAFRISKTDLRIRPIYHRLRHRIEAHICIAFCAYKIYKELDRQLKAANSSLSPEKAIDIANTIFKIIIETPFTKAKESRLHLPNEEQVKLLELFKI
jgi:transposase